MRKISKRFPRKRSSAFIAKIKDGVFVVGMLHSKSLVSFSSHFLEEPQGALHSDTFLNILFSIDVQMSFFIKSEIYRLNDVSDETLNAISLPRQVIRPRPRPFDPDNPFGIYGPFPNDGGSLVELEDRFRPSMSSSGRILKEILDPDVDAKVIQQTELSVLWINFELKERLAACHAFGGNIDPYKARTFEDCALLQNDIVRQTHWYQPHKMPLLGLKFDIDQNNWVPA